MVYKVDVFYKDGESSTKFLDEVALKKRQDMFKNILGNEYIIQQRGQQLLALDGTTFVMAFEWKEHRSIATDGLSNF